MDWRALVLGVCTIGAVTVCFSVLSPYITALLYAAVFSVILNPVCANLYDAVVDLVRGTSNVKVKNPQGVLLVSVLNIPNWLVTRHVYAALVRAKAWLVTDAVYVERWASPLVSHAWPTLTFFVLHILDVEQLGVATFVTTHWDDAVEVLLPLRWPLLFTLVAIVLGALHQNFYLRW